MSPPTNASGGYGVVIGPATDDRVLAEVGKGIEADPGGFVAQPLVHLSTCPTVIDGAIQPRRVDLGWGGQLLADWAHARVGALVLLLPLLVLWRCQARPSGAARMPS